MTDLIQRPSSPAQSPALRASLKRQHLALTTGVADLVEEEIDDYKAVEAMPGVMRIPEKHLAREIERIANAGIRSGDDFRHLTIPMKPAAMPGKMDWWRVCRASASRPCQK